LLHRKLGATAIHNAQAPEVIAEHLEQAGRYHEAAPYRLQAAEKLSRVFDHAEALEQYEKMLAYLPQDSSEMHLEVLCLLGSTHLQMSAFDQAKTCFDQAQKLLRFQHPPRLRATIWIGLCRVAHGQADVQRMLECGQQALFFAWSSQDVLTNGLALRWLGFAEHQAGLWKTAKQHLTEAHMQFQSLGDKRNAAETLQIWALTLQSMGDSQGSQKLLEQSSGMYKLLDETHTNPL
jgi:tetratricopeptide (TPR) repeat protein